MTVKELKEEISGFKDDSQVLISPVFTTFIDGDDDEVIQDLGMSVFQDDELFYIGETGLVQEADDDDINNYCREEHVSIIEDI